MRKTPWKFIALTGITIISALLWSSRPKTANLENDNNTVCCKIKMNECMEKQEVKNSAGEMILENLSRQFLLIAPF